MKTLVIEYRQYLQALICWTYWAECLKCIPLILLIYLLNLHRFLPLYICFQLSIWNYLTWSAEYFKSILNSFRIRIGLSDSWVFHHVVQKWLDCKGRGLRSLVLSDKKDMWRNVVLLVGSCWRRWNGEAAQRQWRWEQWVSGAGLTAALAEDPLLALEWGKK